MQLFTNKRLTLLSAVAAAMLAACGGGNSPTEESAGLSPMSAEVTMADALAPQSVESLVGARTPSDSDFKARMAGKGVSQRQSKIYIVQLAEPPAASYKGGIAGLNATKPVRGTKAERRTPDVQRYRSYLTAKHDQLMRNVGATKKVYSYSYTFNGFAAELTEQQAQRLAMTKGVLRVTKDTIRKVTTASTTTFLGLAGESGFYNTTGAKGENVVIGMVDSGIWPENNAFADRVDVNGKPDHNGGTVAYAAPVGWNGSCTGITCNNKLIGARYYSEGFGGDAAVLDAWPFEYASPRDWGGHGTHTSSTAGGNADVAITGANAGFGTINGIAPRARIATYKVCWASSDTDPRGGCATSDSMAAIEDAIDDGVDVINFSISGTQDDFADPVEFAFAEAAIAGVFVATSAGNDGPDASTVNHPSPWVTTVAAGTHNRAVTGGYLQLGETSFPGVTNLPGTVTAPIVLASAVARDGADATKVRLCFGSSDGEDVLDPAKVAGKIVVCDRGSNFLINKSTAVYEKGGVGVVIVNVVGGATTTLQFGGEIPSLHTTVANRDAIVAYAGQPAVNGTIGGSLTFGVPAPHVADFSSRGPAVFSNVLKPDVMAPGVDILAAVAPPGNSGGNFGSYQGTSMSSPHIAGIAALFKEAKPDWSPMAIKSALMTTAYDILDGPGTSPSVIFAQGAGFVKPMAALDPGLVYDVASTGGTASQNMENDVYGFYCGVGVIPAADCADYGITPIDPVNMNTPSIALGNLTYQQTVTRRVTNVSNSSSTYTPTVAGFSGVSVTLSPSSLTLAPGETKSYTATFKRTRAPMAQYVGGTITWKDATHKVRIPVVIRPVPISVPTQVSGSYPIKFGYTGQFSIAVKGLVPATVRSDTVFTGSESLYSVDVPNGTAFSRFALNGDEYPEGTDLDLYVFDKDFNLVGQAASGGSNEIVDLTNPAAGTYYVYVVGYSVSGSLPSNTYIWSVSKRAPVNGVKVTAPRSAKAGVTGEITVTPARTLGTGRWLGLVNYLGSDGMPAPTIIRIDRGVSG